MSMGTDLERSATQKLRDEKELRALDRVREASQFRSFLADQVLQPLSDARDALGFDPPEIEAAKQRIEMVVAAIRAREGSGR